MSRNLYRFVRPSQKWRRLKSENHPKTLESYLKILLHLSTFLLVSRCSICFIWYLVWWANFKKHLKRHLTHCTCAAATPDGCRALKQNVHRFVAFLACLARESHHHNISLFFIRCFIHLLHYFNLKFSVTSYTLLFTKTFFQILDVGWGRILKEVCIFGPCLKISTMYKFRFSKIFAIKHVEIEELPRSNN